MGLPSRTLAIAALLLGSSLPAVAMTFEDRVEAQAAIERVYWSHRVWPKDNPAPRPSFESAVPRSVLEARVVDAWKKTAALDALWRRPVTSLQLQAELDRIASQSKDPNVLRELFAALGNDPRRIAETLARGSLVDRLVREYQEQDAGIQRKARERAERALASCASIACMGDMEGEHQRITWKLRTEGGVPEDAADVISLAPDEWGEQVDRLTSRLGAPGRPSALQENQESFFVTAILSRTENAITVGTVSWPKTSFDAWWESVSPSLEARPADAEGSFVLPVVASACTADTWTPTHADVPDPRDLATAVWTGTEMIVWGGRFDTTTPRRTGGRYNPATNTWTAMSLGPSCPTGRYSHTAVWTGSEMIVWGGQDAVLSFATGGRYNPATDTWTVTATGPGVPSARASHTAVWTGSRMVVWGGIDDAFHLLASGGRYDPATDSWTATSTGAGVPPARELHVAVWTGSEMIVWGGVGDGDTQVGGRYNPVADTWTATSTTSAPALRWSLSAVWTGAEMIVWGGATFTETNTGGRYRPSTDTWTATSTGANVPSARRGHTAVWTGSRMIVWGGEGSLPVATGGRYDPVTNAWTAVSATNAPAARARHVAVWTGSEMIVWGGQPSGEQINTGARYSPASNTWVATQSLGTTPSARYEHTAVYTGAEMIVWGGWDFTTYVSSGGRYTPATDSWAPTSKVAFVPQPRRGHTAVWTGTEMIVWGGTDAAQTYQNGSRYDPVTDTWSWTSSAAPVPSTRYAHSAVWTGTRMIVWGGLSGSTNLSDGGRYDPATDSWTTIAGGVSAPSARHSHSATWTGSEMIVWGGYSTTFLGTGSRYYPGSNAWAATSTGASAATPRYGHTTVWTGSEMIVWGGVGAGGGNAGARYDPAGDVWHPISTGAGAPPARSGHSAVWTGWKMLVWGGFTGAVPDPGGLYDAVTDSWTPLPPTTTIDMDTAQAAVWDGKGMIVWGGSPVTATGGYYCLCPNAATVYPDFDGDGYGDPNLPTPTCDGIPGPGYVTNADDCFDLDPTVHPGGIEVCDGVDNDCNGPIDDGVAPAGAIADLAEMKMQTDVRIEWAAVEGATHYDVLRGSLALLRSTGGDFTSSSAACIADDFPGTSIVVPGTVGDAWYLVRGANSCNGAGTWNESAPSQVGNRDTEIAAASAACP